jgi:CheY-like chemotaxis protein
MREVPKFRGDPARLQLFLDRLHEARHGTERVSTIVRDLRAFARTDQESTTSVDLRRVLGSALRVASAQIDGVARVVEHYEPAPTVQGNAARLEQVFLNLLINAAQSFSSSPSPDNEIRVVVRSQGQRVISEISDNGAGIDPELLSRVFDPFFTTKPGVGTGLGLPICHSIVTRLGGEIDVDSAVGRGTTFRVSLPARPRTRPEHLPTPQPERVAARRARVLVVDDELPLASMLSRVLSDEHEVIIATSARDALDELTQKNFDVVLCDLLMPVMSGMDLYRELKERLPGTEQRMVFMTGGAFTPRAAEFLTTVPNPRLEKPFDLNQVRQLVRKLSRPLLEQRSP